MNNKITDHMEILRKEIEKEDVSERSQSQPRKRKASVCILRIGKMVFNWVVP